MVMISFYGNVVLGEYRLGRERPKEPEAGSGSFSRLFAPCGRGLRACPDENRDEGPDLIGNLKDGTAI